MLSVSESRDGARHGASAWSASSANAMPMLGGPSARVSLGSTLEVKTGPQRGSLGLDRGRQRRGGFDLTGGSAVPRLPKRQVNDALADVHPSRGVGELLLSTSPRGAREAYRHSAQCAITVGPSLDDLGADDEMGSVDAWWMRASSSTELADLMQAVAKGKGAFAMEGGYEGAKSTLVSSFANLGMDVEKKDMVRYVVKEGDTVWDVCVRNQIDVNALLAVNPRLGSSPNDLAVGEVLRLPDPDWVPPEDPLAAAQREADQFMRAQEEEAEREAMQTEMTERLAAEQEAEASVQELTRVASKLQVIDEDECMAPEEPRERDSGGADGAGHRRPKRGERRTFRRMHGAAEDEARVAALRGKEKGNAASTAIQKVAGAPLVSMTSNKRGGSPPRQRKYSVEAGDTIFRIAKQHGVSVDALVEANRGLLGHSRAPLILERDVLVIPEAKGLLQMQAEKQQTKPEVDLSGQQPLQTKAATGPRNEEAQKKSKRRPKVAMTLTAGGSVSSVVNVQQVQAQTPAVSAAPSTDHASSGPQAVSRIQVVTVQKGECLAAISRAHGVSVESLREFNGIHGDRIIVGQMLLLPPAGSTTPSSSSTAVSVSSLAHSPLRRDVRPSPLKHRDLPSSPMQLQQQPQLQESTVKGSCAPSPTASGPKGAASTVIVKRGDTMASIATRHATTVGALRKANMLTGDDLFEGETLVLPNEPEQNENGEHFLVDGRHRKGKSRKTQGNHQSLKLVWDEKSGPDPDGAASRLNYLAKPPQPISGVSAEIDEITGDVTYCMHALSPSSDRSNGGHGTVVYKREKTRNAMDLAMPIDDGDGHSWVSSRFGWRWGRFHEGLDVAAYLGTPITSADSGKVSYATYEPGYGNIIEVEHRGGYVTRYAHCHELIAKVGQVVQKGETIASVGQSGSATGPHLHFEVRKGGKALNPSAFIAGLQCHVDD